jgi:hypothetical protein
MDNWLLTFFFASWIRCADDASVSIVVLKIAWEVCRANSGATFSSAKVEALRGAVAADVRFESY